MKSRESSRSAHATFRPPQPISSSQDLHVLEEDAFQRMICLERKRTERSRKPLLLMLLDASACDHNGGGDLNAIISMLASMTRVTDITGWYKDRSIIGVMFTEINLEDKNVIKANIFNRVGNGLRDQLSPKQVKGISISFHFFPEAWNNGSELSPRSPTFYPDLQNRVQTKRSMLFIKRLMDIVGSVMALALCAPIFIAIAMAIRVSSPGPILFRQRRVGHHGMPFDMLKFRSMYVNNDPSIHKEYVTKLVSGTAETQPVNGNAQRVYKLTRDPRITRVGALLRRTSLDELPQFANVLMGEMSLVGPRPPLPYEVEAYDLWHRRRLLEAKPGVTGLWQVSGRNRITFDDMVRLDLRYAKKWSPWLDLKILLRTPLAVVKGAH